ncbi:Hsp70 family protein [Roseimaritima sediminicola]|uniref:Hsp70 family protein n=1 Tax=Roseimaritima sediminicola TaxID=2662066 RepID=UPI0012982DDB|nr:Hsp70 family protein [Roseimaritima sediminicola]
MATDQPSSPIVGIDLGTTNSVVAAVVQGKPQVLTEQGAAILPSVVGLDPSGKTLVGTTARNQLVAFPQATIASIKRKMGSMDPVKLAEQEFTPPEISAIILRRLRDRASAVLGTEITRAVITVPAFFDESQRQATKHAGELAGLTVERIINEPTAATLVYHVNDQQCQHVAVYDFGGGTFDVSIVRIEEGVIEVLSSRGDTHLGGDDLDSLLVQHVAEAFYDQHEVDLRADPSTRWRLINACEAAKCRLSSEESVTIAEEFIAEKNGKPLNLKVTIDRNEYETLIAEKIQRTVQCVHEAIQEAGLNAHNLDDLILVGGSTRTPMVERRLREEFQLEPSRAVDPDLAVALGAAVQGAMIAGEGVDRVLIDVVTHTLGIEALDGEFLERPRLIASPIIHRGTALPARFEESYYAVHEDQEIVKIHVLQGEHKEVERNTSLGHFTLPLKSPSGHRAKILVRFELSLSGTLKVTAQQSGNDDVQELTIDNALSRFDSDRGEEAAHRLEDLFTNVEVLTVDDEDRSAFQLQGGGTEPLADIDDDSPLAPAHRMLQRAQQAATKAEGEDAEDLADLCEQLQQAIRSEDRAAAEKLCEELDDVLFYINQ